MRPYHLILFLLSACTNTKGWLAIIGDDTIKVKVLIEEYELTTGLMFHKTLDSDSGYLFLFPRPGRYPFWMKNTYIPLSIAFIDSEDRIIAIDSMIPLDTVRIFPPGLITMALEVNQGWFKINQVKVGDQIVLKRINH